MRDLTWYGTSDQICSRLILYRKCVRIRINLIRYRYWYPVNLKAVDRIFYKYQILASGVVNICLFFHPTIKYWDKNKPSALGSDQPQNRLRRRPKNGGRALAPQHWYHVIRQKNGGKMLFLMELVQNWLTSCWVERPGGSSSRSSAS